ncbi:unnamed protein product, partial [Discosporangium mesarthrocarpum]
SEIPWLLLSGSWDGTVRAWDVRRAKPSSAAGNAKPEDRGGGRGGGQVGKRGIGSELGGWGGENASVAVMRHHVADVYGISAGKGRPFLHVSVSRDTTVRQFTLEGIVSSLRTMSVMDCSLRRCLSSVAEAMMPGAQTRLCGPASQSLAKELRELQPLGQLVETYRRIFRFFWGADGVGEFWDTLRWCTRHSYPLAHAGAGAATGTCAGDKILSQGGASAGEDRRSGVGVCAGGGENVVGTGSELSSPWKHELPEGLMVVEERVTHRDARLLSSSSLADRLEKASAFVIQDRRLKRVERLEKSAGLHLVVGRLQRYCEVMVKLGRWEHALSLAPGAGMGYWRELAERLVRGELKCGLFATRSGDQDEGTGLASARRDDGGVLALLLATGRVDGAINNLAGREEGLTLAAAIAGGAYARNFPTSEIVTDPLPLSSSESSYHVTSISGGNGPAAEGTSGGKPARRPCRRGEAKLLSILDEHRNVADAKGGKRGDNFEDSTATKSQGWQVDSDVGRFGDVEEKASGKKSPSGLQHSSCDRRETSRPNAFTEENRTNSSISGNSSVGCFGIGERTGDLVARGIGEAALQHLTCCASKAFFQSSQPVLAAAALLSRLRRDNTKDRAGDDSHGSPATSAINLLARGDEPELAYAAGRALSLPGSSLVPLVREMARRAEAWGDVCLATELLLDTAVETSEGSGCGSGGEQGGDRGPGSDDVFVSGHHDLVTAGQEGGVRGAILVAAHSSVAPRRGHGGMDNTNGGEAAEGSSNLQLRSKTSYAEEAGAALRRGREGEAVRCYVLAGDMEQAVEEGLNAIHRLALQFPQHQSLLTDRKSWKHHDRPALLSSVLVLIRALGSGPPLNSAAVKDGRTRQKILAYASYAGGMEAEVRGYHTVAPRLFLNAAACVQAAAGHWETSTAATTTGASKHQGNE